MLTKVILICSSFLVASSQTRDGTLSFLPETIFGEKTFLPEIIPVSVRRLISESGQLTLQIRVLYTEDALISWFASGLTSSATGEKYLLVSDNIPSEYLLNISIPREITLKQKNTLTTKDDNDNVDKDDIFDNDDGDFLVFQNELYVKFETLTLSEAAVLKISLAINESIDNKNDDNIIFSSSSSDEYTYESVPDGEDSDEHTFYNGNKNDAHDADAQSSIVLDESSPNFPEMVELDHDVFILTPGFNFHFDVDIAFTDNDRFSVRGIIYNSTSNTLFTTMWATDFSLGPSQFVKIPMESENGDDGVSDVFEDNVRLVVDSDTGDKSSVQKRIHIDLLTKDYDISGVYKIIAHHLPDVEVGDIILESSLEQTLRVQKEDQVYGPIPLGVLNFEGGDYTKHTCVIGSKCIVSCRVLGLEIDEVFLLRKDGDGEFVTVKETHTDIGHYEALAMAVVDSAALDTSGIYLCKAKSGSVTRSKEIDLIFVVE